MCYAANEKVLKEDARNKYRSSTEKQKDIKRKYQSERYLMNTDLNDKPKAISKKLLCFKKNK